MMNKELQIKQTLVLTESDCPLSAETYLPAQEIGMQVPPGCDEL